jgi:HAD superfamily hydrolase (TIGR01509 family)
MPISPNRGEKNTDFYDYFCILADMEKRYGLIFDVDGVIADTEPVNARASIRVFAEMFGVKGVVRKDFDAGLGRGAENYMRAAAAVHNLTLTDEQIAASALLREKYILDILNTEPLPAFPGILNLIEAGLSRPDFRVGIATSSSRELCRAMLTASGMPYDRLQCITGSDVRNKKPNPEIFLKAAARIGISPCRCIVIEDAPNGVEAARAAGAHCIAVTNSVSAGRLAGADQIVTSLSTLTLEDIAAMIDSGDLRSV